MGSSDGFRLRANSFLLSLCSPVLHKMICGSFAESSGSQIEFKDVNGTVFDKTFHLWCGNEIREVQNVHELLMLGSVADRFQMTEVISAVEDTIMRQLSVDVCCEVLNWGGGGWLEGVKVAARKLAVERFEEVAATDGFLRMSEEMLESLLEEDGLGVGTEEAAFEAAVAWMKAGDAGSLRGRGLLEAIRFPMMGWEYLENRVREVVGGSDVEWIGDVVEEALRVKEAIRDGVGMDTRLLGRMAKVRRARKEVRWEEYKDVKDGGGLRLRAHPVLVTALAVCGERVCNGSLDGTVRVWNRERMEVERVLRVEGRGSDVWSLAGWHGFVISGHRDKSLRVWRLQNGECEQVLQGHTGVVHALAVLGSRLVSGSWDQSIKFWGMRAGAPWECERTLVGHVGAVLCVVTWGGKVVSGSDDATVRVWDAGTGAHDAALAGHGGPVNSLAVDGDRVYSASRDGAIRVWAAGTWAALRTVQAYAQGGNRFVTCLAVSGSKLVTGSCGSDHGEVETCLTRARVDARTLEPRACVCVEGALTCTG